MAARSSNPPQNQRARVLDAALELMSRQGSAGTSMRQLANACDMNVATLYHYFPSKAELVEAVIAERRYIDRMAGGEMPAGDPGLPAEQRFRALFSWLWRQARAEGEILRLIVGEGARGEPAAQRSAQELVLAVDKWLTDLVDSAFPEAAARGLAAEDVARLVRSQLLGLVVEELVVGPADG